MHEKPAYADVVGRAQYAQRSVAEQRTSETSFLKPVVDGKAGKDGYRDRIRHVAPESPGRLRCGKRACRQRVIGNNAIPLADHERS